MHLTSKINYSDLFHLESVSQCKYFILFLLYIKIMINNFEIRNSSALRTFVILSVPYSDIFLKKKNTENARISKKYPPF